MHLGNLLALKNILLGMMCKEIRQCQRAMTNDRERLRLFRRIPARIPAICAAIFTSRPKDISSSAKRAGATNFYLVLYCLHQFVN